MKLPAMSVTLARLLMPIVLFGLQSLPARADACPDTAQQYWRAFRTSVLQGDLTAITNASRFPFVVFSGILDSDREEKSIDREEFVKLFPAWLEADPGLSPTAATMKSLVEATVRLTPLQCSTATQFRVGDWVFRPASEGWRFVEVYTDE